MSAREDPIVRHEDVLHGKNRVVIVVVVVSCAPPPARSDPAFRSRSPRSDGNCFFRGFCFAYLEYLVSSRNSAERERMRAALSDWGSKLEEGGFERIVFEDALELLQEMVDGSADGTVEAVRRNSVIALPPLSLPPAPVSFARRLPAPALPLPTLLSLSSPCACVLGLERGMRRKRKHDAERMLDGSDEE